MKAFKADITLSRNARGCYILDTVKVCSFVNAKSEGCYGDCYAKHIADRYRLDFGHIVRRDFKDDKHLKKIIREIKAASMPFIRIGEMGDPSWDWEHTLSVCEKIKPAGKPIVIITKHWVPIPDKLLPMLEGICINTSVSALDEQDELAYRLQQHERIKPHCRAVLRIVSCNFNMDNHEGQERAWVQNNLFQNDHIIDTVFRPSPTNNFLVRGVIKAEKTRFLRSTMLASVYNPKTYFGACDSCPEMCGVDDTWWAASAAKSNV